MTRTRPFQMRMSPSERDDLQWGADQAGLDKADYIRRLVSEDVDARRAELGEQADRKLERQQTLQTAFPQGPKKCRHVRMGQYCYVCREKRFG